MSWTETRSLTEVRAEDLAQSGMVFRHDQYRYRTTGQHLDNGGMGTVFEMERLHVDDPPAGVEAVVGKTFHAQYLYQLRTDEVTRRDHQTTLAAVSTIASIEHPNLLPTYLSSSIADNHIFITPRKSDTLLEGIAKGRLTPRRRVALLIQAMRGLETLHQHRVIHRDFTLRNILLDKRAHNAYLFDFDLALKLDDVAHVSYKTHYKGRIFGSPGFSVPPEILDPGLMQSPITSRLDVYAIGGALFGLFTDQLPYGKTEDMWGLLVRIAEGIVLNGVSKIEYPEVVPRCLHKVIDGCLERDPGNRYGSIGLVCSELERVIEQLDDGGSSDSLSYTTQVDIEPLDQAARIESVHSNRLDETVNKAIIEQVDTALGRYGYQVRRSLGRVKGLPIFQASPDPELIAMGQFPDSNTYPKIVTAVSLSRIENPEAYIDAWFGHYLPILMNVRQGLLTSLFKVVRDDPSNHMLIFSEFVVDARFGSELEEHDLTLVEALGLGFLIVRQVARMHEQGLAHNNVRPQSLLLKGAHKTNEVHPAMVGLIDPSSHPLAFEMDVRQLAALVHSWIRASRIEALEPQTKPAIEELRARLTDVAYDNNTPTPGIDELFGAVAGGFAAIDGNFQILRQNGGDLQHYALLHVSRAVYHRLWGTK
jgi:serine/threonine protein kinase